MTMLESAKFILSQLISRGHVAYLAGGAVRDLLIGRNIEDIDIATSAKPEEIERLFSHTISVGKQFGVVNVIIDDHQFHLSTFRGDRKSTDHRHPQEVFWANAQEDANRRDFTINGLFATADCLDRVICGQPCSPTQIVDFVDGQRDILNKTVRFIGDPNQRISDDALRILRAVRFKNNLGLEYDFNTKHAIIERANDIKLISGERIRDELNKMLNDSARARSLRDLLKLGVLAVVLPEIARLEGIAQPWKFHGQGDALTHTLLAVEQLPPKIPLLVVWATLLHDIGKPDTKGIVPDRKYGGERIGFYGHHIVGAQIANTVMKRLHFARDEINYVCWLVENHMMIHEILEMRAGRQKRWLLDPRLPDLLELHRADASGKGEGRRINLDAYQQVKKLVEDELAKPPPPPKVIDGHDIMKEFNLKQGPEVGRLLKLVEDEVWDDRVKTKAAALQYLKKLVKTRKSN